MPINTKSEFCLEDCHYKAYTSYRKRMAANHPTISAMTAPEYFHTQSNGLQGLHALYGTSIEPATRENFWRQYFADCRIVTPVRALN